MRFPDVSLNRLSEVPITNGLGEAASDGDSSWPRYIRTTDITGLRTLDADKRVTLPREVAEGAWLEPGDLLMTAAGSLGTSHLYSGDEPACYAGYLVRFRPKSDVVDCRFAAYWTQSQHHLDQLAVGAVKSTIENFSAGKFRQMKMPLPSLEEQRRIADFLDEQVALIDAVVRLRRSQSELIEEGRLSALRAGFAQGRTVALRRLLKEAVVGIVVQPAALYTEDASGIPALRGTDVREGAVSAEDLVRLTPAGHAMHPRSHLAAGDVLVVRTGDAGASAVVPTWAEGWNCIDLVIARVNPAVALPDYVSTAINAARHGASVAAAAAGSIQQHFGVNALLDLEVPALSLADQRELVQSESRSRSRAAEMQRAIGASVVFLNEYKRSLITAAVTGELDVTTARPEVPA